MDKELTRLRALQAYSILDTPPEPNFDRVTELAAMTLDQPVCTLSLADAKRHWFKSRYGVSATEMPRQLSFCDETIRGEGVFIVPDALADARFALAPIVSGPPHMRFYAGAPLLSPAGYPIGSLCVLDVRPHPDFDARKASILANLAYMAMEMLEARSRQIELAALTNEVAHMARHDPLTGLANRRLLAEHMDEILRHLGENEQIAVLYLDLDRFKEVNDTFGHPVGDLLLQHVAQRLRRTVRVDDKVTRLGGDEFAIIHSGPAVGREAADLAGALIAAVSAPYEIEGLRITIGASVGIALAQGPATHPDQMFRQADIALYRAKAMGRGRYVFFHPARRRHHGGSDAETLTAEVA